MELKKYQRQVIADLKEYLALLHAEGDYMAAYKSFWQSRGFQVGFGGIKPYQDLLPGTPNLCFKIPTGGGKTYLACNAVKPIFDALPDRKVKAVVWLVPSDSILDQTIKALRNPSHPYRQHLNACYGSRVAVYDKKQLLSGENFNITTVSEQLSVMVLSYDSFRGRKESLKSRQENSSLVSFAQALGAPARPLKDTDETALIQVINQLSPLVIVDESHHARSQMSLEMLENFNPCFVLDLTATPRKESNVISYVDAIQLKRENMVKLPVIVYNRNKIEEVVADAKDLRDRLEREAVEQAKNGGMPIRPIVLFQAQPRGKADSETFEKLKNKLIAFNIPAHQIAIKTAEINELRNVDLAAPDCTIRYIITVNALKEGWDCPNAYILASLANKTSQVEVEQIVGRILRLPGARKHQQRSLNMSYVLTCSANFQQTLDRIVEGLNYAGFSKNDCRVADEPQLLPQPGTTQQVFPLPEPAPAPAQDEDDTGLGDAINLDPSVVGNQVNRGDGMISEAVSQGEQFEQKMNATGDDPWGHTPSDLQGMKQEFSINEEFVEEMEGLQLPMFFVKEPCSLFTDDAGEVLLTKENLTSGFSLRGKATDINWRGVSDNMFRIDISERKGGGVPQAFLMSAAEQMYLKQQFAEKDEQTKLRLCEDIIHQAVNGIDAISAGDARAYVQDVIRNMSRDQIEALMQSPQGFALRVKEHVNKLVAEYSRQKFDNMVQTEEIICKPSYTFPRTISPADSTSVYGRSLYESEETGNQFETELMQQLSGMDNIRWWHRNMVSRTGFFINAYKKHYPDFIVCTKAGKIVLLETKGDHLDNAETESKLILGDQWCPLAGPNYRYFLVFQGKEKRHPRVQTLDSLLDILRKL